MARNEEKAQSMLYRFREAQAAELGVQLNRKGERRPRLASSVKNLRECEKWRGDVLREISRKVSKIQDFGLTDYEVRDLNDEINKLIREKGHWENQIIALGGANYKRGVPKMLDDSGKEVPGTRGYKYFGRAKDLPGVKELFERTAEDDAEMESFKSQRYQRFRNVPASYYGDMDEEDGVLLSDEAAAEEEAWREGYERLSAQLGVEVEAPPIPRPAPTPLGRIASTSAAAAAAAEGAAGVNAPPPDAPKGPAADEKGKRKATGGSGQDGKRQKGADGKKADSGEAMEGVEEEEATTTATTAAAAAAAATGSAPSAAVDSARVTAMFSVLDAHELEMPVVPDREETTKMILDARKKALREEYIGGRST